MHSSMEKQKKEMIALDKIDILQKMKREKLVAVIRTEEKGAFEKIQAIAAGGIALIEITMTMPGALALLEKAAAVFRDTEIVVGAGTILDAATARLAMLSGAAFIVSPAFHPEVARLCNLYRKIYIPGIQSANDVSACLEWGSDVLKLFPCNQFSTEIIKDLKGPFPQANFMVTGKMSLDRIEGWLESGAFAAGIGGILTNFSADSDGRAEITAQAARFVQMIKQ